MKRLYGYDPAGNRLTFTKTGSPVTQSQYNAVNEITGWTAGTQKAEYTWDDAGNLFKRKLTTNGTLTREDDYTFDALNRLTRVSVQEGTNPPREVRYGYDPAGRRMKQVSPDGKVTWFVFDGLSVVMELDASKEPVITYVPGISKTSANSGAI